MWAGKEQAYERIARSGRMAEAHRRPDTRGADWLWQAFNELSTCRQYGPGVVGPIPLTAIWSYVDRYEMSEWVADALHRIDMLWMQSERARTPPTAGPPSDPPHPRRPALNGA